MQIKGVGAIVTGGASGLGQATARRLIERGANVSIIDLAESFDPATAADTRCHYIKADVTNEMGIQAALEEAASIQGEARILVNCAGVGPPAKVISRDGRALPLADFARIVSINLLGSFNVLSKFTARICELDLDGSEERGVIVNTASVAAFDGQIGQTAYSASKAAIVGMTLPLARELARYSVRVMTVAPGLFRTPLLASLPEEAQNSLGRQVPFPSRLGEPDEYARLIESIIENPMLNGEAIRLDGAIRMSPK